MPINEGFSVHNIFRAMVTRVINTKISHGHSCNCTCLDRDADHGKGQRCFAASGKKSELFEIGETLFYTKEGFSTLVKVEALHLDSNNVLQITVVDPAGEKFDTTREHLRSPSNPDVGWIPTSVPEYKSNAKRLSDEEIEAIASPKQLSPLQQEFLSLHHRLFHLPMHIMLRMSRIGILPKRFMKLKNDLPPCVSCLFGQAHRRPWRIKTSASATGGVLRSPDIDAPGQVVGTDQLVSAQPGLVPQEKGHPTRARIWGATIFVDYATKWIKVHLMQDATLESTLQAKEVFESDALARGVKVKRYHADNGRYADPDFVSDCKVKHQKITFCGVGAHHQNGVSENTIKQLTLTARTLLLHAQRHWPEYISTMLCPLALLAAADRLNHLHVDTEGQTPEMKFSDAAGSVTRLKDFHTFGCPCYVLDARLQSSGGPGPPKWDPRSRLGIYVGHSLLHAGSVALVLNPKTGLISPQFHVVFDDNFSTVPNLRTGTVPDNWSHLVQHSRQKCFDGFYDVTKTWFEGTLDDTAGETLNDSDDKTHPTPEPAHMEPSSSLQETSAKNTDPTPKSAHMDPSSSLQETSAESTGSNLQNLDLSDSSVKEPDILTSDQPLSHGIASTPENFGDHNSPSDLKSFSDSNMPPIIDLASAGLRRLSRTRSKPARLSFFAKVCAFGAILAGPWSPDPTILHDRAQNIVFAAVRGFHSANQIFDGTLNSLHHMALLAGKENNESYTYKDMLKQPDRADFIRAMLKETDDHENWNHWEVIPRWQKPPDAKTILAIWSFKRKRYPDGRLNKHKVRLCAHGGI